MVRKLLATTAIASVLATGAFAQSAAPTTTTEPAMSNQGMSSGAMQGQNSTAAAPAAGDTAPVADIAYIQSLGENQYLTDDLMDMDVYASADANAQEAGEIENLVVAADGTVKAVVIDTGSYLGDQSKTIAVPFDQISWTMGQNNEPRAVLTASREQLMSAPTFTTPNETAAAMGTGTGTAGTTAMAPGATTSGNMAAGGMAPQSDMAASTTQPATTTAAATPAEGGYLASVGSEEFLASNLVGDSVYSGANTSSDRIGDINNLIVSSNGRVEGIVIGVGGFLGIGEKDVGVPFDNVSMTRGENGQPHAMLAASRDQLKNAPSFEDDKADQMAANTNTTATGTTGMTAGTAAGTAGMAAGTASTGMATDTTDATTTASTGGTQAMNAGSPVTGAELSADNLMGTSVYGPDNQTIGSIGDIALTPQGQVDAVIVDVGGFLGIGAKPVAVAMDNLNFLRDSSGKITLTTQFTQDQLRNAPEYNRDTYAQNRDNMRVSNPGDIPATTQAQ